MDKSDHSNSRVSSPADAYIQSPKLVPPKKRSKKLKMSHLKKPAIIKNDSNQLILMFDKNNSISQPTITSSQTVNTLAVNTIGNTTEVVFSKQANKIRSLQPKSTTIEQKIDTTESISTKFDREATISHTKLNFNISTVTPQIQIQVPVVPPLDHNRYIQFPSESIKKDKRHKKSRSVFDSLSLKSVKKNRNIDTGSIQSIQLQNEQFFNDNFGNLNEKVYFARHLNPPKFQGSLPKLSPEEIKYYQLQKDILDGSVSKKNIKYNNHFKMSDPTRNEFLSEKFHEDLGIMKKQFDLQKKRFELRNEQSSQFLDSTQNSKNSLFNSQSFMANNSSQIDSILVSRSQLEIMQARNISKDQSMSQIQNKNRSLLRYPLVNKKNLPKIEHYRSLSEIDLPKLKNAFSTSVKASPQKSKLFTPNDTEQTITITRQDNTNTRTTTFQATTTEASQKKNENQMVYDRKFNFKKSGSIAAYEDINLSLQKHNDVSLTILDKRGEDFEQQLLDQLEYEAEELAKFKSKMKKYRKELSQRDKLKDEKMDWLSSKLTEVEPNTMQLLIEEDMEVPTGKHAVRASNFIKHMLLIDDVLTDQIDEAHEVIKDQPDGDVEDRYYIQAFKAQRKKERAKSVILKQLKLQTRKDLLELLRKSLETKNKLRKLKFTPEGKIDIEFCLKKFAKKRRFLHNNDQFEFEEAVKLIIETINQEFFEKQDTKRMGYVFESQEKMDHARVEQGLRKIDENLKIKELKEKRSNAFESYLNYIAGNTTAQFLRQDGKANNNVHITKELLALRPRKSSTKLISLDTQTLLNYVELFQKNKADLRDSFINRVRQFDKFKQSLNPSKVFEFEKDPMFQYMNECSKNLDTILPLLSRVRDYNLTLDEYKLQFGHCRGISSACKADPFFLNRVVLFRNDLTDEMFAELLNGFKHQSNLKRLSYSYNHIGPKSLKELADILAKNIPLHLMELRISNCTMRSEFMPNLVQALNSRSYLQNLFLVKVPLQSCYNELCEYIQKSRHLRKIDLSYNTFTNPSKLLKVIERNVYLVEVNLSWNNLSKCTKYLRKLIKRNNGLQHLILTATQLSIDDIITLSNHIARSKSLQSVHLCKNVDVSDDVLKQLRAIYYIDHFANVNKRKSLYFAPYQRPNEPQEERKIGRQPSLSQIAGPISNLHREAIIIREINNRKKVEQRQQSSHVDQELEHLGQQQNRKLIITRMMGHSKDLPFSEDNVESWKILHQPFHKCWICSLSRYTILFWKKDHHDKHTSLQMIDEDQFFEEKAEEIFEQHQELSERVMICGSFNNWKPQKMVRLTDLLDQLDPDVPDILQMMRNKGVISAQSTKTYRSYKDLSKKQQVIYNQIKAKIYAGKRREWPEILLKNCVRYKEPAIINGEILNDLQTLTHISDIYVHLSFMEPGKNDYVVRYLPSVKDRDKDIELKWAEGIHQNQEESILDDSQLDDPLDQTATVSQDDLSRDSDSSILESSSKASFSDRVQFFHGRAIVDVRTEDPISSTNTNPSTSHQPIFDLVKSQLAEFAEINSSKFFTQALQFDMMKIDDDLIKLSKDKASEKQLLTQQIEEHYNVILRLYQALRSQITLETCYPYIWPRSLVNLCQLSGLNQQLGLQRVQRLVEKQGDKILRFNIILFLFDLCQGFIDIEEARNIDKIGPIQVNKDEEVKLDGKSKLKKAVKAVQAIEKLQSKSHRPKISKFFPDLIQKYIEPNIHKIEQFPHDWREKNLYSSELDHLYQFNKVALSQIYRSHASSVKRNLYIEDFMNLLLNHQDIGDLTLTKGQIISCFSMCKMPVAIETNDQVQKSYLRLSYAEFLDFITRAAIMKFQDTDQELLSLHDKVVHILDDIFESIGIQAKDPCKPFLPSQLAKQQKQFANLKEDFESPLPKGYAGEMLIKDYLLSKRNSLIFDQTPIKKIQKYVSKLIGDREVLMPTLPEDSSSQSSNQEEN